MPRNTHIGPYRILRLINQGGQGTVYLGFDDRLHRRVAIKIYQLPKNKAERQDVLGEAQSVASIQSPKVVQIYDVVVANDHVALIMEYVPGCDLEEFLASRNPGLASIVTICIDIAGALAAARQQHLVHGDLKASNILITSQGHIKLTDFGIARGEGDRRTHNSTAGSISCMSPEQYLGQPLDVRSDMFALGCLLYRMLTGELPFVRGGELNRVALLETSPVTLVELRADVSPVPADLMRLLTALLQKSPDNRPANTQELRNTLRHIARDMPLSVSNTLLQESEALFRKESPEDVPPVIPHDLTRNGRSSLQRTGFRVFADALSWQSAMGIAVLGLVLSGLFGSVLVQAFFSGELPVLIVTPTLKIATTAAMPEELSSSWLANEIEHAVGSQFGSAQIAGGSRIQRDRTFYSPSLNANQTGAQEGVPLRIVTDLQCVDALCLLRLTLEHEGRQFSEQRLIFSNMSISRWTDGVHSATVALLRQIE